MIDIIKVFLTIAAYLIAGGILLALCTYIVNRTYPSIKQPITVTRDHNKIKYIPHNARRAA